MDPKYCIVHECEKEKGRLLSQSLEVEPYMPFPGIEPIYACYWKWTPENEPLFSQSLEVEQYTPVTGI